MKVQPALRLVWLRSRQSRKNRTASIGISGKAACPCLQFHSQLAAVTGTVISSIKEKSFTYEESLMSNKVDQRLRCHCLLFHLHVFCTPEHRDAALSCIAAWACIFKSKPRAGRYVLLLTLAAERAVLLARGVHSRRPQETTRSIIRARES